MKAGCCLSWSFLFLTVCMLCGISNVLASENEVVLPDDIIELTIQKKVQNIFSESVLFGKFEKGDGPFYIHGNIVVPYGESLEFGAGSVIYLGDHASITVFGQLLANGSSDAPIVFTSIKKNPQNSRWDRIYCRSRDNSVFDHCFINNSINGIIVENGLVAIKNSVFEANLTNGIAAKNSDVSLLKSSFSTGHLIAINLQSGATVEADSVTVTNNVSAIACHQKSTLKFSSGSVTSNVNGIVVDQMSNVTVFGTDITRNKNGVVSAVSIPRRKRESVFGNAFDLKLVQNNELDTLLLNTQSSSTIIIPQNKKRDAEKNTVAAAFSALNIPEKIEAGFLGNVTFGANYFIPASLPHPREDTLRKQTHYPEKIQPDIQVFASGKRGGADVNLLMDLYGNQWLAPNGYVAKNMFNLSMNFVQQNLTFGDFFENGTETSISGRQITGLKYIGQFSEMGGGTKRFEFKLAAGESEIPKDSGDHELNIYNETVDSGMSVRQQITYLASVNVKPSRNSNVSIKGIIARDQVKKPLFRPAITDPGAPDPIEAQTGCIDGSVVLFNGKLELFAELDLGSHDSLDDTEIDRVAWYNPDFKNVLPDIFSMFNRTDFPLHYALSGGAKTTVKGFDFNLKGSQIARNYFSAGNPYLEKDRRTVSLSVEKKFRDNLSTIAQYDYEKRLIHDSPTSSNTMNIHGEYSMGENKPAFIADYTARIEKMKSSERVENEDTVIMGYYDDKSLNNLIGIEGKQNFENGFGYSLRYQLLLDNDFSDHLDTVLNDIGDRLQNQFSGTVSFKIKRILRNQTTIRLAMKNEKRDSLSGYSYKIADRATVTIIPRKLSLMINGEYGSKKETRYSQYDAIWEKPVNTNLYSVEMEAKYSITSKIAVAIRGMYEKSYDETTGSSENYTNKIAGLHLTYLF